MKSWLIPIAAGFGAGILSAWGVGGGTLLLLVMTLILGVPQQQAAAVNLLSSCLRRPWASSPTSGTGCWKRRR